MVMWRKTSCLYGGAQSEAAIVNLRAGIDIIMGMMVRRFGKRGLFFGLFRNYNGELEWPDFAIWNCVIDGVILIRDA